MYSIDDISRMIFIDIETTYKSETFDEHNDEFKSAFKKLLDKKFSSGEYEDLGSDEANFRQYSTLNPEYSRISTIVIGAYDKKTQSIKTKTFIDDDEKVLLIEFNEFLSAVYAKNSFMNIVGHYIKYFDIPFLIKRMLANGLTLHQNLHLHKMKPWENLLIDTYDVYKFGGIKSGSLEDICILLDIPSPKSKYESKDAPGLFYTNKEDLVQYCENDVRTNLKCVLKMAGIPYID